MPKDIKAARNELLDLQERIEDNRQQIAELEGRKAGAVERLQELGVKNVVEAKKKVKALNKEAEVLEDELHDMLADLEEHMG